MHVPVMPTAVWNKYFVEFALLFPTNGRNWQVAVKEGLNRENGSFSDTEANC